MVAVLLSAGLQAPVIPLVDVVGNGDKVAPEQIGETAAKVGVMFGLTVKIAGSEITSHPNATGVIITLY